MLTHVRCYEGTLSCLLCFSNLCLSTLFFFPVSFLLYKRFAASVSLSVVNNAEVDTDLYTQEKWIKSSALLRIHWLCVSVSHSKPCSLAERSDRLSGEDSSVWSPGLSGSSAISVWTGILNMHTETHWTHWEGKSDLITRGVKKSRQWWHHWFPTTPAFLPYMTFMISVK